MDKCIAIFSGLFFAFFAQQAMAERTVTGTVADADNTPVAGAHITFIYAADAEQTFDATTASDGGYEVLLSPILPDLPTAVGEIHESGIPKTAQLFHNYPNPFNPNTVIPYNLAEPGYVELSIYNVLGHKIRTLVDRYQEAGAYSVEWDGHNALGVGVSAGVYFYRLKAGGYERASKMVMVDGAATKGVLLGGGRLHKSVALALEEQDRYTVRITGEDIENFQSTDVAIPEDNKLDFTVSRLRAFAVDEEVTYFHAPQTMTTILAATRTVNWTSYTGTFTNLDRLCLGIKGTADLMVIDDSNPTYAADLTVKNDMTASTTHTNDDLLKATFKLLEVGIDTYMMVSAKHSNYAIDYDTIGGIKTLVMRDYRSYYVDESSAGFLIFTLTTQDLSTYLSASARHALDSSSSAYIADDSWTPLNVAVGGASAILTSDSGTAFTMFTAYNSVLDQNIPFDFNPTSVARVTNAEAEVRLDGMNKLVNNMRDLSSTYSNQTANPGLDPATTAAADAFLAEIVSTLEMEGSGLRYPVDFYKTVRENMLSRKINVSDSYNLTVGSNSVPYVYFTNEADSNGLHHPFMVIGTYAVNEGMTHLWDIPRPPGDGAEGTTYPEQTVTRNVGRSGNLVKIAMKDYGEIDALTENVMVNDLATDSPLKPEFDHLNYASTSATGIALDGVVVYPTYNNQLNISAAVGEISNIGIHSGRGLAPHYHADAYSATKSGFNLYNDSDYSGFSHPPIITIGFDGVAGYGVYRDGDTTSDGVGETLDDWGGHDHDVYEYHYHSHTIDATHNGISFTAHILPPKGAWRGRINEIPNFWNGNQPAYGGPPDAYHGVEVP